MNFMLFAIGASMALRAVTGAAAVDEQRTFRKQAPTAQAIVDGWAAKFEAATFATQSGLKMPYRILRPASPKPLPLIVILHGSGAIGADNRGQLGPFGSSWALLDGQAIVVVPQAPSRTADYRQGPDGLAESLPGPAFALLLALIDALAAERGTDRTRIHLVGFSMGGSAALQAALARPGKFASVVAFAPVPPPRSQAAMLARQRMTLVHGDVDVENAFAADVRWVERLRQAGGKPRFIVYRGMGHQVPDDMIAASDWRQALLAEDGPRPPRNDRLNLLIKLQ